MLKSRTSGFWGCFAFSVSQSAQCILCVPVEKVCTWPQLYPISEWSVSQENLSFEAQPIRIVDQQTRKLKGKAINMVKVLWDAKASDSTWESEEIIRENYLHFFTGKSIFDDENFSCLGECNSLKKCHLSKNGESEMKTWLFFLLKWKYVFIKKASSLSLIFTWATISLNLCLFLFFDFSLSLCVRISSVSQAEPIVGLVVENRVSLSDQNLR